MTEASLSANPDQRPILLGGKRRLREREREVQIFLSEQLQVWAGFPPSNAVPTMDFLLKIAGQTPADSGCGLRKATAVLSGEWIQLDFNAQKNVSWLVSQVPSAVRFLHQSQRSGRGFHVSPGARAPGPPGAPHSPQLRPGTGLGPSARARSLNLNGVKTLGPLGILGEDLNTGLKMGRKSMIAVISHP